MIFVKNPEPGRVKTRLAKTLGDEKAYEIYLRLLYHTMKMASNADCVKEVWYSAFVDEEDLFNSKTFGKKLQSEGDLGKKMSMAFKSAFNEGYERVVIIGSDCPGITDTLIESAFELLAQNELVIGPANDGGYYLLGMSRFIPELFIGVPWSTDKVFGKTVEIAESKQVSLKELPVLVDIDNEDDLNQSNLNWYQ